MDPADLPNHPDTGMPSSLSLSYRPVEFGIDEYDDSHDDSSDNGSATAPRHVRSTNHRSRHSHHHRRLNYNDSEYDYEYTYPHGGGNHEANAHVAFDDIVFLPPPYRRIFVGGTLAFLLLVLLAASTLSSEFVPNNSPWTDPSPASSNNSINLRERDEQESSTTTPTASSFAEAMMSLVQQAVEELAQTVQDYENSNNNSGGDSDGSNSEPAPSKAPVTTSSSPTAPPSDASGAASSPTTAPDANGITTGSVNGVAYYGCRATSDTEKTILLFHGASFTKEQWKSVGILDSLCSQSTLTVYAFDLSVSSTAEDLQALLDTMQQSRLIMSLPVNAIVTPSASGYMVVDWGLQTVANSSTSFATMSDYWRLWVPVASPAVASVDPKSLLSSMFPNIQILAVHGDQDTSGGRVMQLLGTYAGATVVTISGGHACYMQSPDDFVKAVLGEVL